MYNLIMTTTNETPTRVLPGPMMARSTDTLKYFQDHEDLYILEKKLDGFRGLVEFELSARNSGELYSRAHKPQQLVQKLPQVNSAIGRALHRAGVKGYTVLDGELSTTDDDFYWVAGVMKSLPERARALQGSLLETTEKTIIYVAFDVLVWDGRSVMDAPWTERRAILDMLCRETEENPALVPSQIYPPHPEIVEGWLETGGEGGMVKRIDRPYVQWSRPKDTWYKLKYQMDADVVVMGFTQGQGKFRHTIGAIQFGQYRGGHLEYRGQCSGMTDAVRESIFDSRRNHNASDKFMGRVMTISHNGIQRPAFRHPQWLRWRDDKEPEDCVWDN